MTKCPWCGSTLIHQEPVMLDQGTAYYQWICALCLRTFANRVTRIATEFAAPDDKTTERDGG